MDETTDPQLRVYDNTAASRFEAHLGQQLVGVLEYQPTATGIVATHTEVQPQFEGRGLGSQLVKHALNQLQAEGRKIQPVCSFVAHYIREHPAYADLLDHTA